MDKQQLEKRLQQLTTESSRGQQRLQQLDRERRSIEQTLLRIDGAMALISELLDKEETAVADTELPSATKVSSPGES